MNEIIEWSQGNPGAMSFLMNLSKEENLQHAVPIVSTILPSKIRGTDLYILYSDLANKDMAIVEKLCVEVPLPVLEDACSRQDYSGIDLVKEYI